jgi:signal transduction histidine kinase
VVDVTDHGATAVADPAVGSGMGLIGMRERVEVLGGTVEAGPWEHGWRVHVELPTRGPRR